MIYINPLSNMYIKCKGWRNRDDIGEEIKKKKKDLSPPSAIFHFEGPIQHAPPVKAVLSFVFHEKKN